MKSINRIKRNNKNNKNASLLKQVITFLCTFYCHVTSNGTNTL